MFKPRGLRSDITINQKYNEDSNKDLVTSGQRKHMSCPNSSKKQYNIYYSEGVIRLLANSRYHDSETDRYQDRIL